MSIQTFRLGTRSLPSLTVRNRATSAFSAPSKQEADARAAGPPQQ
jgi:hypothetical protein